jgi:hypothetical protein
MPCLKVDTPTVKGDLVDAEPLRLIEAPPNQVRWLWISCSAPSSMSQISYIDSTLYFIVVLRILNAFFKQNAGTCVDRALG